MLNIKHPEAYRLAKLLAARTGESMTTAVTIALRERLANLDRSETEATVDELLEIGRQIAAHSSGPQPTLEEFLYGPDGLPR